MKARPVVRGHATRFGASSCKHQQPLALPGRWATLRTPGGRHATSWVARSVPVDERPPSPTPVAANPLFPNQGANGYLDISPSDVLGQLARERLNGHHAANGHTANGHTANGHTANGHAANGHAANGHAANGHAANDHGANGHAATPMQPTSQQANGAPYLNGQQQPVNGSQSAEDTLHAVRLLSPLGSSGDLPASSQGEGVTSNNSHNSSGSSSLQRGLEAAYANGHANGHATPTTSMQEGIPITLHPAEPPPSQPPSQPLATHLPQQPSLPSHPSHLPSPQGPPQPATATTTDALISSTDDAPDTPTVTHPTEPTEPIPKAILVISFVSACLTMASCVFNTLLPIYMVTELKMNMRSMGMFEGLLEAFSYVVRMFSGVVSDMMRSRKSAITLGFAMGAMAKFGMSGAVTVSQLFASKAVDRLANGVQAAPRDALISDLAPASSRSACFGFAQSMRKWGSFIGAGMSYLLMRASGNNYQLIFLGAASVTVLSTLAFVVLVPSHSRPLTPDQQKEETAHAEYKVAQEQHRVASVAAAAAGQSGPSAPLPPPKRVGFQLTQLIKDAVSMGSDFYRMLLVISMYGLGHINESMLEARAIEVGFGKAESTLVVALLALTISISAWPLGKLDDKHGPRMTFGLGMSALILGNLVLMMSGTHPMALFGSCLFLGVHWAVIQGPLLAIVVSLAPSHLRGTAFGIFYTVMAVTTVIANSIFGTVWHTMGANSAFSLSAGLMVVALLALPHLLPESLRHGKQQQQQLAAAKPAPA